MYKKWLTAFQFQDELQMHKMSPEHLCDKDLKRHKRLNIIIDHGPWTVSLSLSD